MRTTEDPAALAAAFGAPPLDAACAAALGQRLLALLTAGRAAWPGIDVPGPVFAGWLAARWPGGDEPEAWLRGRDGAGLYLACACLRDAPGAVQALERSFLSQVPVYLARLAPRGAREEFLDEVRQLLREKLLLGEGRPRLGEYAGQGALGSFVRVTAVRLGIDVLRQREAPRAVTVEDEPILAAQADPELAFVKERYRPPVRDALRAAMAALTSEERNLLRLHFIERLSIDRLGEVFHIHRATAARRLQQARARVAEEVRREVRARLQVEETEAQELIGLLCSQLDLSLRDLVLPHEDEDP